MCQVVLKNDSVTNGAHTCVNSTVGNLFLDMTLLRKRYDRCVFLACHPTSQQYCSLILNQHQPPATSQSALLFSRNKSAPVISHSQTNTISTGIGYKVGQLNSMYCVCARLSYSDMACMTISSTKRRYVPIRPAIQHNFARTHACVQQDRSLSFLE